ncbi:glycosyltransferase [Elizabethkingia ursingii]|uniref:glycosyltransferase n=1 Tax=Elizabethkingia ursingii TaxID=1756150 RepID=UPI002013A822|nr:glycosyltransferase [Elizabethkingia ursingii]MCL1670896.1 glycosyltransferase [Elizabethkingia ursingii]
MESNNDLIMQNNTIAGQSENLYKNTIHYKNKYLPKIAFISTFPPKVCGIATYSQDLVNTLRIQFPTSFQVSVFPLESNQEHYHYPEEAIHILKTFDPDSYIELANRINEDPLIKLVLLQHEFGFFTDTNIGLSVFLKILEKEVIVTFHTVLPKPDKNLKEKVQQIVNLSASIIVMTSISSQILIHDYNITPEKIKIIPHGTHLLAYNDKIVLKSKYHLTHKKVLSTFGLLGPGKNIETTLKALPEIISQHPDVIFLIIGKTHPMIIKTHGEEYRNYLKDLIKKLDIENHVAFINSYLPLEELLEYLQLTDVYLFTSKDRNQAVSGTFSYAISSGCPIVSTPIPHALEVLKDGSGLIIDFESPQQLAWAVKIILKDKTIQEKLRTKALEKMAPTAWENSSLLHAHLFQAYGKGEIELHYTLPEINLEHFRQLTTDFAMLQFSILNRPDIDSGYTLDDNARAMIAMCQHYMYSNDPADLKLIAVYLNFIDFCQMHDGSFLNYVDKERKFTPQNYKSNLEDSNGRAIWALGFLISQKENLPEEFSVRAEKILQKSILYIRKITSPRAIAFIIKGLYYQKSIHNVPVIKKLANKLLKLYQKEARDSDWQWFEPYLTYANSVLPEALLCAWLATGNEKYKHIAFESFHFLLSKIIIGSNIKVISNKGWLHKQSKNTPINGGEQPIDIAYTILALSAFYKVSHNPQYLHLMQNAMNWFLGQNHLNQIIYNPATGGCYDGLEQHNVNLNQGAESTVSYLMARLCLEKVQENI